MHIYTTDTIINFYRKFQILYPRSGKGKWSTFSVSIDFGVTVSLVIEARGSNHNALSLRTWAKL